MRRSLSPIVTTASAASGAFLLVLARHGSELTLEATSWSWLLAGIVYTQLVEYWYHAIPMHRGLPWLGDLKRHHMEHHRVFHGPNFRTRERTDTWQIPGRWWVYPLVFLAHYALLTRLLDAGSVVFFLLGSVLHYLLFEITHWFTHIEDNAFDRFIDRIPFLRESRAYQIEHHRIHHEIPVVAFNFNPPYLGDRLTGRMPRPALPLGLEPVAQEPLSLAAKTPPTASPWRRRLRYGTVFAVGTAAVIGVALLAHGRWSQLKADPSPKELSI